MQIILILMKPFKFLVSLLLIPLLLLTSAFAAGSQAVPRKVLLVVRMEGKSLPIDQKIQQHLASRGYVVTLHSQYAPVDAAQDTDLVILSSTVRSRDLLGAYRNMTAPMLTWESDLLDDITDCP